jgi:hypothetical protein
MTRLTYVAAPACIIGYGVLRLIDGLDGTHGPGPWWSAGHLLFLAGMLLYAVVLVQLRGELTRRRPLGTVAVALGFVGVLAFVRVILVDLIVGFQSANRAEMDVRYDRYDGFPGGLPSWFTGVLGSVGPLLFLAGLLTLAILLVTARPRLLPWWSPVAIFFGYAVIPVSLDLLPLGGALLTAAMLPLVLSRSRHAAAVVDQAAA